MERIKLSAKKRTILGKAVEKSRASGDMPGVIYGHGLDTQSIQMNEKEFSKAFKQAGENTLINLNIDGKDQAVLIQEVQYHYLKGQPIHVDFYAVKMDEKLKAKIPVHFTGESPAVKALGGVLVKNLSEVEVECLPGDLPTGFEVDISKLNTFEDIVRVSDLQVSDKVKILASGDEPVVNVAPPRSEAELESLKTEVVEDVTKVEGVVKPESEGAVEDGKEGKKDVKIEEKKEKKE